MANDALRALWMARIQQWRESGLTQSAFAQQHGFRSWQVSYWVARFTERNNTTPLVPVRVKRDAPDNQAPALTLHSPSGWTVTIPPSLPAAWLGELLRSLR